MRVTWLASSVSPGTVKMDHAQREHIAVGVGTTSEDVADEAAAVSEHNVEELTEVL